MSRSLQTAPVSLQHSPSASKTPTSLLPSNEPKGSARLHHDVGRLNIFHDEADSEKASGFHHDSVGQSATVAPARRTVSRAASSDIPGVNAALSESGRGLDPHTLAQMENSFQRDFSAVRIHDGPQSINAAKRFGAKALSIGEDIISTRSLASPATHDAQRMLVHELAHVAQRSGSGTSSGKLAPMESEADAAVLAVARGSQPSISRSVAHGTPLFEVDESQLARPQISFSREGTDEIVLVNGNRAYRVQHAETGKPVQRTSAGGNYSRLKGQEYSPAPGISISWRWDISLAYSHPVTISEFPAAQQTLRGLFPAVEFKIGATVTTPPKPAVTSATPDPLRAKLRSALREIGQKDLDNPPSPFDDFPALKVRERGTCVGNQPSGLGLGNEPKLSRVDTSRSLAQQIMQTHWSSRQELEEYMDDYLAAAANDPLKSAQAVREKQMIEEELENTQTDLVEEQLQRAVGEQVVQQNVANMQVRPPEIVLMHAALGEAVVIPIIKGVDLLLDFVPYVGQIKMLIEAVSGRSISGQLDLAIANPTTDWTQLPPDLDTIDRLIRIIPVAVSTAGKIASRARGAAETFAEMKRVSGLSDEALQATITDMSKLAGREREIAASLIKIRKTRLAMEKSGFPFPAKTASRLEKLDELGTRSLALENTAKTAEVGYQNAVKAFFGAVAARPSAMGLGAAKELVELAYYASRKGVVSLEQFIIKLKADRIYKSLSAEERAFLPKAFMNGRAKALAAEAESASGPAKTPGTAIAANPKTEGGLRIDLSERRAERLAKAERAETWTDLSGTDRTSLGKAYGAIVESLTRELTTGGRAKAVLHYVEVDKALIGKLQKGGGRVVITQGRLNKGKLRFDIAEIDFDKKTIDLIDLTPKGDPSHLSKTVDYEMALKELTGFKVNSSEHHYVEEGMGLADDLKVITTDGAP